MKPAYQRLEEQFSDWSGKSNTVSCCNGSAALHLALEALDLPPQSEVLLPDFTMVACARAVTLANLTPKFVDCTNRLLMDIDDLRRKITRNTKVIMPVHIYGRLCDMEGICDLADIYSLHIVEDCAESHGAWHDYPVTASCWSFYQNKIVAGEEGGMISFTLASHAEQARSLKCHGFTIDHNFMHQPRGMNYRLSNANSELILDSLSCVEDNLHKRKQISKWYDGYIPHWRMPERDVDWVYDLRIRGLESGQIEKIVRKLNRVDISARCGFKPMSVQPEYVGFFGPSSRSHRMSREIMYLPISPGMTEEEVSHISQQLVTTIKEI